MNSDADATGDARDFARMERIRHLVQNEGAAGPRRRLPEAKKSGALSTAAGKGWDGEVAAGGLPYLPGVRARGEARTAEEEP